MAPESSGQQDVRTYLGIIWRWKLLLLTFLVLIPLGAYFVERGKPKIYEASTLLNASGSSLGVGTSNLPVSNNPLAVARLVTTDAVAKLAAERLGLPAASAGSLLSGVSASADSTTGFLTITVEDNNPARAAAVANAFAAALSGDQAAQANQSIKAQLAVLEKQLKSTRRSDQVTRSALTQQITQLKALATSSGIGSGVIDPAVASATPIGPNTRRAVELAFVIALLLGVGAVLVAENSDRRLRSPEDLERLTEKPLLGTIPRGAFSPDKYLTPRNVEAFQTVRAALTYYNVDRPLSSVVIISPGPEDGKTTVAIGLAIAEARAGAQAILIDADLRRPQIATRLGIPVADGLGAVLTHERELDDVLIEHPVDAPEGGRLLVLPAGPPPANPSALISSPEMRALLRDLEGRADLVIVDTAATLAVSDSLPLIQAASGLVMIVRMNRSSRAAVRRLQKVIASVHGTVMGAVATGTGTVTYGYGGDGYYETGNGNGRGPRGLGRLLRRSSGQRSNGASSSEPVPVSAPARVAPSIFAPAPPAPAPAPAPPAAAPAPAPLAPAPAPVAAPVLPAPAPVVASVPPAPAPAVAPAPTSEGVVAPTPEPVLAPEPMPAPNGLPPAVPPAPAPGLARDAGPMLASIQRPNPPPAPTSPAAPLPPREIAVNEPNGGRPDEQSWRRRLSAARKTMAERANRPGR